VLPDGTQTAVAPNDLTHSGTGSYLWPNGRRQAGTWDNGKLHGEGVEETSQGFYSGMWAHGQRQGEGKYRGVDGTHYQGHWSNNQRQGYGRQSFSDRSTYQGEWQADLAHGFGERLYVNGSRFEGSWAAGKRQGYGTLVTSANLVYEGLWQNDMRQGYGRQSYPDGRAYQGNWSVDRQNGIGIETHADRSSHNGRWENGEIVGIGTRTHRTGIQFTGEWVKNVITQGQLVLPSGDTYNGPIYLADVQGVAPDLVKWIENLAGKQNTHAQYFLATIYLDFDEPKQDLQTAEVWLRRSATAGHAEAQYRLAILLNDTDQTLALDWLSQAANQAHPDANALLGGYYHLGKHLPLDLNKAITHYSKAASQGDLGATNNLAWLLATTQDESLADPQQAVDILQPLVLYLGNWQHLDTLAAAHARLGHAAIAIQMQFRALEAARQQENHDLSKEQVLLEMQRRLELYKREEFYTE